MREIHEAVVHCAATRANWWSGKRTSEKVREIKRWHVQDRGWRDIGYHYLIDRDGTVAYGRPLGETGAHVMGRNTGTIGICLFGGHGSSETDQFHENFTPAQEKALLELLDKLQARFGKLRVSGHNQYAAKACPGFNVPEWYENALNSSVAPPAATPTATPTSGGFLALLMRLLGK